MDDNEHQIIHLYPVISRHNSHNKTTFNAADISGLCSGKAAQTRTNFSS